MKKELFTIIPKFREALLTNSPKFEYRNEEYTLIGDVMELELLAEEFAFSFAQHRKATDMRNWNPFEMCIVVNGSRYKKITNISLKLLNYQDRQLFIVIKGYDNKGRFIKEVPLPIFHSGDFCRQLIYLFNQEKIYFHIYKDGEFSKHIVETNPFKGLKELEELFGRMEEGLLYKEGDSEESFRHTVKITTEFFRAYPQGYTEHLIITNPDTHYFYLN